MTEEPARPRSLKVRQLRAQLLMHLVDDPRRRGAHGAKNVDFIGIGQVLRVSFDPAGLGDVRAQRPAVLREGDPKVGLLVFALRVLIPNLQPPACRRWCAAVVSVCTRLRTRTASPNMRNQARRRHPFRLNSEGIVRRIKCFTPRECSKYVLSTNEPREEEVRDVENLLSSSKVNTEGRGRLNLFDRFVDNAFFFAQTLRSWTKRLLRASPVR